MTEGFMIGQPSIVNSSGVVTVTMPKRVSIPSSTLSTMLPNWNDLQTQKVVAELEAAEDGTHLIVTITSLHDSNREPWGEIVRWILQHVWEKLVALRIVTGPMPNIVHHNSLDMLPTTA